MIVASLLLILVAVTLLVLGLTGGSSNFLISSIVASLLAAVALVIGARQNASARRAAEGAAPADPRFDDFAAPAEPFAAEPADSPAFAAEAEFAESRFAESQPLLADQPLFEDNDRRETVQFRTAGAADLPEDPHDEDSDQAYHAGRRDAADTIVGTSGARPADDLLADDLSAHDLPAHDLPAHDLPAEPDYERAADAINAARSLNPEEHTWRRTDAHAEPGEADLMETGPVNAGLVDEDLGDADDDDPADEPLPQVVSPGDAVRVARLDAEVLVVDGRPRYHVSDCQHLVGKLSEPIPVNEAVELGFSPCGLCRPVDRLVAAAARH
ncbi:hypothetical protein [Paractinoplanes durhamensis]|uniref:Clumping factor A n=1 Tax=Paractinoplanes durhamensis TaxID=113563 RepID=A0ABQ3ZCS2_9ACTN|nr:hypothetical protein [Actinoplanes durhamensis]GIE07633.1 hypothetical protein Adu01nite_89830 [Actinoplanes durhamensis]